MGKTSHRLASGAALAAAATLALTACGSGSGGGGSHASAMKGDYSYGAIPAPASNVKQGGVLHVAEDVGADPNWIFPITPSANSSVYTTDQFQYLSWRVLYYQFTGSDQVIDYSKSLAAKPVVSNGGKTFTIKLNGKYTWSTGDKVTSKDVLFDFDLLKAALKESPANSGNYTPGQFPDNVTNVTTPDDQTIAFTFDKVYNPDWVLNSQLQAALQPLPAKAWSKAAANGPTLDFTQPANAKKIYDFLAAQSKQLSTYGTNPLWQVVDGPYKIKSYNSSTGAASFVANTKYTGEGKPTISEVDLQAYQSPTAEFNDLLDGKLDFGYVKSDNVPQLSKLKAKKYNIYGMPDGGFHYAYFNFKDGSNNFGKAISNLYIRQAFAELQDQQAEIKGAFDGLAAPQYGPVGVAPKTAYTPKNALTNPYPFSVANAKKLLTDHGWKVVPNGETTCQNPGTGANQCGAGITKGQNLDFTFVYGSTPKSLTQMVTAFAANLKQIGITAKLKTDTFNNIITNQNDVSSPKTENTWGMADFGGFTANDYPSTNSLFNTGGSYNMGGYSNPATDKAISASMLSPDSSALATELTQVTNDLPGLFQPSEDYIYAWSPKLSGSQNSFAVTTQFYLAPEDWYFTG